LIIEVRVDEIVEEQRKKEYPKLTANPEALYPNCVPSGIFLNWKLGAKIFYYDW